MNSYFAYIDVQVTILLLPHFRPQSRVLGRSLLCGYFCEQPILGLVVRHLGQKTSAVAGSVWMYLCRNTIWIFPELWLGNGSQNFMGNTEWKHVWDH